MQKKLPINPLFGVSRLFKVANFGVNRKDLWDFLYLIHCNLGAILHRS